MSPRVCDGGSDSALWYLSGGPLLTFLAALDEPDALPGP